MNVQRFSILMLLIGLIVGLGYRASYANAASSSTSARAVPPIERTAISDDFTNSELDAAWSLRYGSGSGSGGQYSLIPGTPGYLRYHLTPDGKTLESNALWIHRPFSGEQWVFETKVSYSMPSSGQGRHLFLSLLFGELDQKGIKEVRWHRDRDCCTNPARNRVVGEFFDQGTYSPTEFAPNASDSYYVRFVRDGQQVTIQQRHPDEEDFTTVAQHTYKTELGSEQTVLFYGSSHAGESTSNFAEYDFVEVSVTGEPGEHGNTYFTPPGQPVGDGNNATSSVAWGDVDHDGDFDLAVGNYGEPNYVYLNNGSGLALWTTLDDADSGGNNTTYSLAWGDVDGDSSPELAVGNNGYIFLYSFNDGMMAPRGINQLNFRPISRRSDPTGLQTNQVTWGDVDVAWGDANGDGLLDLAAGLFGGQNMILLNDGTGDIGSWQQVPVGTASSPTTSLVWGDVNDDGHADLAVGNYNQQNRLYLNDGSGNFPTAVNFGTASEGTTSVALGDLNGDGHLDLVVANYNFSEATSLYLNDGTGDFQQVDDLGAHRNRAVAIADADNDGDLDVAVASESSPSSNPNTVWLNNGDGTFSHARYFHVGHFTTSAIDWGDYDSDGLLDLAVGNNGQQNMVAINHQLNDSASYDTASVLVEESGGSTAELLPAYQGGALLSFSILQEGDTYYLWLNSRGGIHGEEVRSIEQRLESQDGLVWSNRTDTNLARIDPYRFVGGLRQISKNGNSYEAWEQYYYEWSSGWGHAVRYVTSMDGLTWSVLNEPAQIGATYPNLIKDGSTYQMWVEPDGDGNYTGSRSLRYRTSIAGGSGWGDWQTGGTLVKLDGEEVMRQSRIRQLADGTYQLFYLHGSHINLATSTDGINFTTQTTALVDFVDLLPNMRGLRDFAVVDFDGETRFYFTYHDQEGQYIAVSRPIASVGFPTVDFSHATVSVHENSGSATITVSLDASFTDTVTVDYATSDGTATAGSDYTTISGTLTFNLGSTNQTFTIPITNDSDGENDETVILTLSNPSNALIGNNNPAILTILDDETAPTVDFSSPTYTVDESSASATITVTLAAAFSNTVTVDYATSNQTATAGDDYTTVSGTLTFAPNVTSQTFTIPIINDTLNENDETLILTLSNASNALIGDNNPATVSILDDDPLSTIVDFSSATYQVSENLSSATVIITLDPVSDQTITVNYATSDESATAGSDYTAISGTLTFTAGLTNQSFTVPISDDSLDENDETVILTLSEASGALIGNNNPALLTIVDNDPLPTSTIPPIFTDSGQSLGDSDSFAVALADLDSDGDLDVFVANGLSQPNQVWLNDRYGTFTDSGQSLGSSSSVGVSLGDLDGDGDLDAFVANWFGQANQVWLNDGHATFTDSGQSLGDSDSFAVALGDLDGDGDLDAFVGNDNQPNQVWLNDGEALFSDSGQNLGEEESKAVALGDLDGDGDLDAFVANEDQGNKVWLNNGHGTFTSNGQSLGNSNSNAVALGDLDDDGDLDAFVANGLPNLPQANKVWLNHGGAFFADNAQSLGDLSSSDVALGDLDGDGDLDAFVANERTREESCGCYAGRENKVWLNDGGSFFSDSGQFLRDSWSLAVALGDLDGDGDLDSFVANSGSLFPPNEVWLNDGGGLFSDSEQNLGHSASWAVAFGDLDGDSDLDAFVANGEADNQAQPNTVWLNNGRGSFSDSGQIIGNSGSFAVALGDLDSDGDLDALIANEGPNTVWLNNGHGSFSDSGQSLGNSESLAVALGDLDSDGDLDAFTANWGEGANNKVWLNDGHGTFTDSGQNLGDLSSAALALGDLDGDGDLDAFVANGLSRPNKVWLNDGQGMFTDSGQNLGNLASRAVALADLDGDGDLDAFVANQSGLADRVWLNDGSGLFTDSGQLLGDSSSLAVALGDLDGDSDLDALVGNVRLSADSDAANKVWLNDGNGFFTDHGQNLGDLSSLAVALGDLDSDGDLDLFVGNGGQANKVYLAKVGGSTRFQVALSKPGPTQDANFYSTPVILDDLSIPITYTLFDPNGAPMGHVAAFYSMDGGENWQAAVATPDSITTNLATSPYPTVSITNSHVYTWDTFASGFFGQSDNVVLRLVAYPQNVHTDMTSTYHYTNSIPGPYLWPYAASTTFPFRVRGTQVQVYSDTIAVGHEVANALVYRLPAGQTQGALPFAADDGQPFTTDAQGDLQGHGQLEIDDRLIALLPITATSSYTLYHTSAVPTVTGLDTFTVTTPGVQQLVVSADNPLILFDLDVSLEWDARNDSAFLEQLESDIEDTSQFLYDWTNGQVALGKVRVYHAKEKWLNSHVIIPASNNLRPSADLGGIVNRPLSDTLSTSQVITDAYWPGQVRMAPIWNRFGNVDDELGLDWPRTLAHELSHYLLFLPDNYLGLSEEGLLALVECQGSAMTDPYRDDYSEFLTSNEWTGDCLHTLGQHTTGRADWETITTFYQMFSAENINLGPGNLPLNVTQVTFVEPETPANTLADPFFYLTDEGGIQLDLPIGQAQGYLFKTQGTPDVTDDVVMPLGVPFAEQIHARGAEPGDRLCVFDYSQTPRRLGCLEAITQGSTNLALREVSDWQPQIRVNSVTSVTLAITVTQSISEGELYVQVLPAAQPITTVQRLSPVAVMIPIGSDTFTQTVTLDYPIANGFVRVWISDTLPLQEEREEMNEFYFSGGWGPATGGDGWGPATGGDGWGPATGGDGWGPPNRYGWGISRRHGWMAPVTARDGQVTILDLEHIFGPTPIYTLQSLPTPPNVPPWLTPVGQAYHFSAEEAVTSTLTIMFDYLQREVPGGPLDDERLRIYYTANEGQSWQRLEQTELDTHHNHASAQMPGEGIYALMSTIEMPLFEPAWNNFGYPVAQTRAITTALASIDGYYTVVANYDPSQPDPWRFYFPTVEAEFADLVNDLTHLEFARAYWLHATDEITLYLGVSDGGEGNRSQSSNIQLPPATFYGWITPSASFTPTVGMSVTARINGNVCGQSTIVELDGQLAYKLQVRAKNVLEPQDGCGASEQNIVFEVGDWVMDDDRTWDNSQAWWNSLQEGLPLAVTLASFTATGQADHVLVEWQTVSELDNLGFNLWRGTSPDRASEQLNLSLISAQAPGSGQGSAYEWLDDDLAAGTSYYYWLEDIDVSGTMTRHGPISVTSQIPAALQLADMQATPAKNLTWHILLASGWLVLTLAGWLLHCRQRG